MRLYRRRLLVRKLPAIGNCNCRIIKTAHNFCQSIAGRRYGVLGKKDDNAAIAEMLHGQLAGSTMIEMGALNSEHLETCRPCENSSLISGCRINIE